MLDYGGNPNDPGHMTEVYLGGENDEVVRGAGRSQKPEARHGDTIQILVSHVVLSCLPVIMYP